VETSTATVPICWKVFGDFPGHLTGQRYAAEARFVDRFHEFFSGRAFEEVPVGAGFEGIEQKRAFVVDGQHQNRECGESHFELAHTFDSRHPGKPDVHKDDIGFELGDFGQGGFRITEGTNDIKSRVGGKESGQAFAQAGTVFNNGHTNIGFLGVDIKGSLGQGGVRRQGNCEFDVATGSGLGREREIATDAFGALFHVTEAVAFALSFFGVEPLAVVFDRTLEGVGLFKGQFDMDLGGFGVFEGVMEDLFTDEEKMVANIRQHHEVGKLMGSGIPKPDRACFKQFVDASAEIFDESF